MQGMVGDTLYCPLKERSQFTITSKIKHAIKLKTSPARLAQLLQPSLAFCFSLQLMTAHRDEGCNSCASLAGLKFYCTFYFT